MRRTVRRLGLLQIDSVNVLVRAHYLPLFSRLGAYSPSALDDEAYKGRRRSLFEYWGHECSLIPVKMHPLFRWRMAAAERGEGLYRDIVEFADGHRDLIDRILFEIEANGPRKASEIDAADNSVSGWWEWGSAKQALEWLFWTGRVTTARRGNAGFARIYDLTERVLPAAIMDLPTPAPEVAQRELVRHAIAALGVATETDLRDYFRLSAGDAKQRIAELAEAGELLAVEVEGWDRPAYVAPNARVPRRIEARALLAPFDPLVWERARAERLFGFRYRLEIYTPAPKRVHGYYVLPFLLGDRLVARLCLKSDRAASVLRVNSAHLEPGVESSDVAEPLAAELADMARWLALENVRAPNGVAAPTSQSSKIATELAAALTYA